MKALVIAAAPIVCAAGSAMADAGGPQACARPAAGSVVVPPPDLTASGGMLSLSLNYVTQTDAVGRTLFCYVTPDGLESPTLHVHPGDRLTIALTNRVQPPQPGASLPRMATMPADMDISKVCGDATMTAQSVNMHFHGANVAPTCGADEVIHTLVNPGSTFVYTIHFPKDEPPGLYWYHPHVHGISSQAVQGGATGVIVVDGIERLQPKVAGLAERILVLRDQQVEAPPSAPGAKRPSWDMSVNYVPVSFPQLTPAVIDMVPGQREFWRVANTSANTIADLQIKYDGVVQTLELVALDGVAIGSQDGTRRGKIADLTDVNIPPAGRAEFIVTAPTAAVKHATLTTLKIDTGPAGDIDTTRVLADLHLNPYAVAPLPQLADATTVGDAVGRQRFEGLDRAVVSATRHLFLSEFSPDPGDPDDTIFLVTVRGQTPEPFDPNAPPAITTTQGAVEDWVIENQSREVHEFHIHQIHFQVRQINGVTVPASQRQFRDTFPIPYWTGKGPYPTVTLRMDFRGDVAGDFVYHCHILDHEDRGMMAIVRVVAAVHAH